MRRSSRGVTISPNTSRCIASHGAAGQCAPSIERCSCPTLPQPHILFLNAITYCLLQKDVTILPAPLLNLRRCDPESPWLPFGEDLESPRPLGAGSLVAQVAQASLRPCAFVPSCQLEAVLGGWACPSPIGLPTWAKANITAGEEVY